LEQIVLKLRIKYPHFPFLSGVKMEREIKRKTQLYGVAAVLLALALMTICYNFGAQPQELQSTQPSWPQPATQPSALLKTFSSYEEIRDFLATNMEYARQPYYDVGVPRWALPPTPIPSVAGEAKIITTLDSLYSTTNIQVAGVDEADIVKTDGKHLYVVSGESIFILDAYPPEGAKLLSKISFNGTYPKEIFVSGTKLVILGYTPYQGYPQADVKTSVRVYDISDRANPILKRDLSMSGGYFSSRMIGDYAYIVISQPAYIIYDTVILPKVYIGKEVREIGATKIYYLNVTDVSYSFTTVVALNVQNDQEEPKHLTILMGSASCMYVSLDNIYITFPKWVMPSKEVAPLMPPTPPKELTTIYRVHIENDNIMCEANGTVPGYLLNQFSMDEYDNHFRVATTTWINGDSQNNVYVLDMNMSMIGKLENLAPGEHIYSARFIGERCYLVTFRQIDPFFVIDVKNPAEPKVLGYLKILGFSGYLHPYDDNHIMGVGMEDGNVKISLFDVSDVSAPTEMSKYLMKGGWSDTLVLSDHKAFLFDRSKELLVIPVMMYGWDKYSMWQGACVFSISLSKGITFKGGISHQEINSSQLEDNYFVNRALYIDDVLYTISNKKIKMNNIENLEPINEIKFP